MKELDAAEARDHLEMVERILAESQQRLCAGGEFFVVWGLFSGGATLAGHLIARGIAPAGLIWVVAAALAATWRFRCGALAHCAAKAAASRWCSASSSTFFG